VYTAVKGGVCVEIRLAYKRFYLEIRKKFSVLRIAQHYSMLPRQMAKPLSLEVSINKVNIQSSQVCSPCIL